MRPLKDDEVDCSTKLTARVVSLEGQLFDKARDDLGHHEPVEW